MTNKDPHQQYQLSQIETASPGKLLIMLYDGAIRFAMQAEVAMNEKRYEEAHRFIIRTEDILTELMASLNMEAGDVSKNLYRIYEYLNWRLIQANIKRNAEMIQEVQKHLRELREAWVEAVKKTGQSLTGVV
jgi:flagellar secretion chaperone FliS